MSKQIQTNEEIYLAPGIKGRNEKGKPVVIDEIYNKNLDPTDINDKVIIYEREVKEWFLNPALALVEQNSFNKAFIVLMICMSYFEGVEQYKTGVKSETKSKNVLKTLSK